MADNETVIRDLYAAWNDRDFDRFIQTVAADATITTVGPGDTLNGPEGLREFGQRWVDAFPDSTVTLERVVAAGDSVVVELIGRGTHTGPLVTPAGTIPATGRSLTHELCDVFTLRDGEVVSLRSYFDTGSIMAQLGISAGQPAQAQH